MVVKTKAEYMRKKRMMLVKDLKDTCKYLGLSCSGTKSDLHNRISSHFSKKSAISRGRVDKLPKKVKRELMNFVGSNSDICKEIQNDGLSPELVTAILLHAGYPRMLQIAELHPRIAAEADSEYVYRLLIVKHIPRGNYIVRNPTPSYGSHTFETWKDLFLALKNGR